MTIDQADNVERFGALAKAYQEVGDRTWLSGDFSEANLQTSRDLYTPESMAARQPRPKGLEVYALLSGLPFPEEFVDQLVRVQQQISAVLADSLHYWVAPANLGVEYCVFKWPTELITDGQLAVIREVLGGLRYPPFKFSIRGIQVNPDGCVVAKGFDGGGVLFAIREELKAAIPFLPARQSGWAHVPMGRILEPLGAEKFGRLLRLAEELKEAPVFSTDIDVLRLVHETRWYMEEKTVLAEYPLVRAA